jgi:hypothetical protein
MNDEEMNARFLEAWQRTGEEYLTRKEIAREFGYSDGWVQLMIIRTNAKPRRVSVINQQRLEFGVDLRQPNRRKNLAKYWARQYITDLAKADHAVLSMPYGSLEMLKAERRQQTAINGLERQFHRLKKLLHPDDPFLTAVKELLYARR